MNFLTNLKPNKQKLQALKKPLKLLLCFIVYAIITLKVTGTTCVFRAMWGVPCPGCGLTRAYTALFRLNLSEAMQWHPLFWYVPIALGVIVFKHIKYGKNAKVRWFNTFAIASTALFIAVFAVRVVFLFPSNEPFVINHSSFMFRIVNFVLLIFFNFRF